MATEETTISIVKIAVLLGLGVLVLLGIAGDMSATSGAIFSFTHQPLDGDTVTLDNHVFEFDGNGSVTEGHIAVTIGASLAETSNNYRTAVGAFYKTA